ncbi:hypothetical protein D3C85_1831610 [compost metagenome]
MTEGGNPLSAAVLGFNDVFFLSACIAVAGVVISLILRKPKQLQQTASPDGQNADPAMMMGH